MFLGATILRYWRDKDRDREITFSEKHDAKW